MGDRPVNRPEHTQNESQTQKTRPRIQGPRGARSAQGRQNHPANRQGFRPPPGAGPRRNKNGSTLSSKPCHSSPLPSISGAMPPALVNNAGLPGSTLARSTYSSRPSASTTTRNSSPSMPTTSPSPASQNSVSNTSPATYRENHASGRGRPARPRAVRRLTGCSNPCLQASRWGGSCLADRSGLPVRNLCCKNGKIASRVFFCRGFYFAVWLFWGELPVIMAGYPTPRILAFRTNPYGSTASRRHENCKLRDGDGLQPIQGRR